MSLDQWKSFLRARLAQEGGKDAEALEVFDQLLVANPTNPHLQSSRAFALERLNRERDAASARLSAAYSRAAASLSGPADKPERWTAELSALVNEADFAAQGRSISAALVAW